MLKRMTNNEQDRRVRLTYKAVQSLPIHKHWACDTVKKWDNRGLVNAYNNGAQATLTERGVETEADDL